MRQDSIPESSGNPYPVPKQDRSTDAYPVQSVKVNIRHDGKTRKDKDKETCANHQIQTMALTYEQRETDSSKGAGIA
jgi:hypothetical protein